MQKPKPFVPNTKNYENFLQWVEEMKKINELPKGDVAYKAVVNSSFMAGTDELPSENEIPVDDRYNIMPVFVVYISYTRDGFTDGSSFIFHFGKLYGAITAWCKNGADEEHNEPLVEIWDKYWEKKWPKDNENDKFATTKLWEILTGFIVWKQEFRPIR